MQDYKELRAEFMSLCEKLAQVNAMEQFKLGLFEINIKSAEERYHNYEPVRIISEKTDPEKIPTNVLDAFSQGSLVVRVVCWDQEDWEEWMNDDDGEDYGPSRDKDGTNDYDQLELDQTDFDALIQACAGSYRVNFLVKAEIFCYQVDLAVLEQSNVYINCRGLIFDESHIVPTNHLVLQSSTEHILPKGTCISICDSTAEPGWSKYVPNTTKTFNFTWAIVKPVDFSFIDEVKQQKIRMYIREKSALSGSTRVPWNTLPRHMTQLLLSFNGVAPMNATIFNDLIERLPTLGLKYLHIELPHAVNGGINLISLVIAMGDAFKITWNYGTNQSFQRAYELCKNRFAEPGFSILDLQDELLETGLSDYAK